MGGPSVIFISATACEGIGPELRGFGPAGLPMLFADYLGNPGQSGAFTENGLRPSPGPSSVSCHPRRLNNGVSHRPRLKPYRPIFIAL